MLNVWSVSASGSTLQDKDEDPVPTETGQNHPFFRRSDSMTFLGCIPPNPFDVPLAEAIPLADQPHLLQVCLSHSLSHPHHNINIVV